MRRTASRLTEDVPAWAAIRKSTDALAFDRYFDFMNWLFCDDPKQSPLKNPDPFGVSKAKRRFLPFTDTDAYRNVKFATEAFVMANCGVVRRSSRTTRSTSSIRSGFRWTRRDCSRAWTDYLEPVNGSRCCPTSPSSAAS